MQFATINYSISHLQTIDSGRLLKREPVLQGMQPWTCIDQLYVPSSVVPFYRFPVIPGGPEPPIHRETYLC